MGKLVKKKLEKGKLIEQIADELEEDINVIQKTAEGEAYLQEFIKCWTEVQLSVNRILKKEE